MARMRLSWLETRRGGEALSAGDTDTARN
jgi:hypothetical protein